MIFDSKPGSFERGDHTGGEISEWEHEEKIKHKHAKLEGNDTQKIKQFGKYI